MGVGSRVLLVGAGLLVSAATAQAQYGYGGGGYGGGGYGGGYARGSFRRTCTDIQEDGPFVRAACRTRDGDYRPTEGDMRRCGGRFGNRNGRLVCE